MSQFIEKTEFLTKVMRAVKGRISVEREKSKKTKIDTIASAVMGDMFNPQFEQRRAYFRYVCKELLKLPTIQSDLVVGLACLDYYILFTLPRSQAAGCFSRIFQSFCVRGWLSRELKSSHMDDCLEFIDDLRFFYLHDSHIGPKIEDMFTFLSSSEELSNRENTLFVFKLCCLCLGHVVPTLPAVSFGTSDKNAVGVDLSKVIEPSQNYSLVVFGRDYLYERGIHFIVCGFGK